jgi:hypothetical protein
MQPRWMFEQWYLHYGPKLLCWKMHVFMQICLSDWTTGVRSPIEGNDFSYSLCFQTDSEVHPASCQMGTGGPFLGVKRGRVVTLTTHTI